MWRSKVRVHRHLDLVQWAELRAGGGESGVVTTTEARHDALAEEVTARPAEVQRRAQRVLAAHPALDCSVHV